MPIRDLLHIRAGSMPKPHAPSSTPPNFSGEEELQKGVVVLLCVYTVWGLLPLYWKQLSHVSPVEVLCHRAFWGFFLVLFLLWLRGGLNEVRDIFRDRHTLLFITGCAFSHMFGWGFYIWAVGSEHILDAALGHYMQPLFSVLCGFMLFRERPRRVQWCAIVLAGIGVIGMVLMFGSFPWVGLLIATNGVLFASLRKKAPVNALPGLVMELVISAPFLWGYLIYLLATGQSTFMAVSITQDLWLIGAGIVTIVPQMGYAYGLCRVPLTTISLMQYIPPTGNFLVGLFVFGESFSTDKIFGFLFIWTGLIIFSLDGFHFLRQTHAANKPAGTPEKN